MKTNASNRKVTKAVIAAAGFGTRFLPQTKAMPKEMLPIIDKPIIQYVVEELVEAGIRDIIIVSNYSKRSIEDHFDAPSAELATALSNGKQPLLDNLRAIANMANFVYVRQKQPLGNAAPLYYASHLLQNEPFIYTWGDDFVQATPSRFRQMIEVYEKTGGSVASCIRIEDDDAYDRYGIVAGQDEKDGLIQVSTIVEKPGKAAAPSNLASVSGFLFTPDILQHIERCVEEHAGEGELTVQAAIQAMIDAGQKLYAFEVKNSKYYDAGNKLEYLKTVMDFGLKHPELGPALRDYLKTQLG